MKPFILAMIMAFFMSASLPVEANINENPPQGTQPGSEWMSCVAQTALIVSNHYIQQHEPWGPDRFGETLEYNIQLNCGQPY